MENQANVGNQKTQQIEQNPVIQPVQIPEKPRINNRLILTIVFGVPVFTYIFFQALVYPLSSALIPILFGDTSNAGLGGLAIMLIITIILAIFFGLVCGLLIYLFTKKVRYFLVGFGVFLLIFAIHRTIIKVGNQKYLSTQVNTTLNSVTDVIGKGKFNLTYISSIAVYNTDGIIDKEKITFKIVAPKTGDYKISSRLYMPYDKTVDQVPKISSENDITISLNEGISFDLIIPFEMKSFVDANYEGKFNLDFDVWRINIQVQDVAWHTKPITEWPVNIADSGKSPNYIISKDTGVERPLYSVGPFYTSRH